MKHRYQLACLWFAFVALGLVVVESYFWRHVNYMGQLTYIVTEGSRFSVYEQFVQIYSPIILVIGAAWFSKPLKPIDASKAELFRFRIALVGTVLFNVVVLYLLASYHSHVGEGTLVESLTATKRISLLLGFLVAWPNVYYFGAKPPGDALSS
jgi:hypothetical protein